MNKTDSIIGAGLLLYCAILVLIAYYATIPRLNLTFFLYFILITIITVISFIINKAIAKNLDYILGMGSGIVFSFVFAFLYIVTLDEQRPRLPMGQCEMPIFGIIFVVVFTYFSIYYLKFVNIILEKLTSLKKRPIKKLSEEEMKAEVKEILAEMVNIPKLKEKNELLIAITLKEYSDRLKMIGKQVIPVILESLKDPEFRSKSCFGPIYTTPYDYMLGVLFDYVDDYILQELYNCALEPVQGKEERVINIDFSSGQTGSTFAKITIDFITASGIPESYKYLESFLLNENEFYKIKVYKALDSLSGNNKADKQLKIALFELIARNLNKDKFAVDALVTLDTQKALEEITKEKYLNIDNEFLYCILEVLNYKKMKLRENKIVELISKIDLDAHRNSIEHHKHDICYAYLIIILNRSNPELAKTYARKGLKWKNIKINEVAEKIKAK